MTQFVCEHPIAAFFMLCVVVWGVVNIVNSITGYKICSCQNKEDDKL